MQVLCRARNAKVRIRIVEEATLPVQMRAGDVAVMF
jgi:hypothetical protein